MLFMITCAVGFVGCILCLVLLVIFFVKDESIMLPLILLPLFLLIMAGSIFLDWRGVELPFIHRNVSESSEQQNDRAPQDEDGQSQSLRNQKGVVPDTLGDDAEDDSNAGDTDTSGDIGTLTAPVSGESSGNLGSYYVEIKDAFLSKDYQGEPAIVITYTWTNNGADTATAMAALSQQAFQGNGMLNNAVMSSKDKSYEAGTVMKAVQPGANTDVQCAFLLATETDAVEFQVSEFLASSGDRVSKIFSLENING